MKKIISLLLALALFVVMGAVSASAQTTEENSPVDKNSILEYYFQLYDIPEEEQEYADAEVYGVVDGFTLYRYYIGAQNCAIGVEVVGEVVLVHGSMGMPGNESMLKAIDLEGNHITIREAYETGELNMLEVKKLLGSDVYLLGDANSDEMVNVKDATAMQKQIAEGEAKPWQCYPIFEIFDLNEDEEFNIKDATAVQKMLVG